MFLFVVVLVLILCVLIVVLFCLFRHGCVCACVGLFVLLFNGLRVWLFRVSFCLFVLLVGLFFLFSV